MVRKIDVICSEILSFNTLQVWSSN